MTLLILYVYLTLHNFNLFYAPMIEFTYLLPYSCHLSSSIRNNDCFNWGTGASLTSSLIKAAAEPTSINLLNLDCTALQVNFNLNCNLYTFVLFLEKMQIQKKTWKKLQKGWHMRSYFTITDIHVSTLLYIVKNYNKIIFDFVCLTTSSKCRTGN